MKTAEPIHPGEILLEEFLNAYDPPVSQTDAADRMRIPRVRLNQLINGHRGVTPDTAILLSEFTGTTAEFWMNIQAKYDLWHAQRDRDAFLRSAKERRIVGFHVGDQRTARSRTRPAHVAVR